MSFSLKLIKRRVALTCKQRSSYAAGNHGPTFPRKYGRQCTKHCRPLVTPEARLSDVSSGGCVGQGGPQREKKLRGAIAPQFSILFSLHSPLSVFLPNLLVLALHLCCCRLSVICALLYEGELLSCCKLFDAVSV